MGITAESFILTSGNGGQDHWQDIIGLWAWGLGILLATTLALGGAVLALLRQKRKQHQALRRARKDNWNLQAVVSHEIRTPLAAVVHLLELSLRHGTAEESRELILTAHHSSQQLLELLEEMLAHCKLESGQLALNPRPTDLVALVTEVAQMHGPGAADKGLKLQLKTEDAPIYVMCDATRLRQVLNNLLSNAVKYTPRGFVSLQLTCRRQGQNVEVELLIGDSGIGMAPELLANLDTPFCTQGETARQQFGGHGLGLPLALLLTRLMQGTMHIESQPARGTRIQLAFDFPLAAPLPGHESRTSAHPVRKPPRALLVEDNPASRLLLACQLKKLGVTVTECENGLDALRSWAIEHPDIMFCDIQIPGKDGLCLAKRIRRLERRLLRQPTVLVCIGVSSQIPHEHPFDLLLGKPVREEELQRALAYCQSDPATAEAPVDLEVVRKLSRRSARFERQFIRTLLSSLEKDSRQLLLARRDDDLQQLSACAHRLLGVTRMMCSEAVNRHCKQLETAALNHNLADVTALLPQVRQDIARVLLCLRRYQHRGTPPPEA